MRVALDATPLTLSSGGITRYVRELSLALASEFPQDEILLVSDQPFSVPPGSPPNLRAGRSPECWIDRRWWLYGALKETRRRGAEVFHGTHFIVPWLPLVPAVMTVHDLSPWLESAWHAGEVAEKASGRLSACPTLSRKLLRSSGGAGGFACDGRRNRAFSAPTDAGFVRRRAPYLAQLGLATMVITPTEAVRRETVDRFGLHPDRVRAVPLAAGSHFRPVSPAATHDPFFLYVGAFGPRKNLDMLIRAWREVRSKCPVDLVLVGRAADRVSLPVSEPGLRFLGEVSENELPSLYSSAAAVLYPSLYEGFGLPVLEAMQCGALVIASSIAAIREVAAAGAILLDPQDGGAWTAAMREAILRPANLARYRETALARAKLFSWARTARETRAVYAEAMLRFGD